MKTNISTVKENWIQNKYSQLNDEMNGDMNNLMSLNDNLANVVLESAPKVDGKVQKKKTSENSNSFQRSHKKCTRMEIKTNRVKNRLV